MSENQTHIKTTKSPEANTSIDNNILPEFKKNKIIEESKKNWNLFYKRNKCNFFKDRHWTLREFNELAENADESNTGNKTVVLLEVGCGVGNFLYPLIKLNKSIYINACDFSDKAIELVKENSEFELYKDRLNAFVCDVTKDSLRDNVKGGEVDVVSLIFVLSAIYPHKMSDAVKNVYNVCYFLMSVFF